MITPSQVGRVESWLGRCSDLLEQAAGMYYLWSLFLLLL
jgi:hypothetical protein